MDIYCPQCGEPTEIDALHDEAANSGRTFDQVRKAYQEDGCGAALTSLGYQCDKNRHPQRAAIAAMLSEFLGDDLDGIAAEMADLEMLADWID